MSGRPAMLAFLCCRPDAAIVLLLFGILLLYAEFNRPGTVLLGCFGMLCAMLALHGLAQHVLAPSAIALASLGLLLILLSVRLHTLFAVFGTILLAYALASLIPTLPRIDAPTALATSTLFSVTTVWLGRIALQARRNKRTTRP